MTTDKIYPNRVAIQAAIDDFDQRIEPQIYNSTKLHISTIETIRAVLNTALQPAQPIIEGIQEAVDYWEREFYDPDGDHDFLHVLTLLQGSRAYLAIKGEIKNKPTPDADGWIEWCGGECPVDGDTWVEVKFDETARSSFAKQCHWEHDGRAGDIVFYRIVTEKKND